MDLRGLQNKSDRLAEELRAFLAELPAAIPHPRLQASEAACFVALEHWDAVRGLLGSGILASGAVVHRSQYEALVRSMWLLFAASDEQIGKHFSHLSRETEQTTKNIPLAAEMLKHLSTRAPKEAYVPLLEFKEVSWGALNSFVHTGRHAIRRNHEGYPPDLVAGILRNSNGVGVFTCMQAVLLSGSPQLQKDIIEIGDRHEGCVPARRDA
jgi:hypothetical protein